MQVSKIFFVCPKISKNCSKRVQNRGFLSFLETFLLFIVGNMLNWKILQFFFFLFKLHIWKMLLVKLHARGFSSNQITGFFNHQYFWKESINIFDFFVWIYSLRKGNIWDYCFCVDVSRDVWPCPKLPWLAMSTFAWYVVRNSSQWKIY